MVYRPIRSRWPRNVASRAGRVRYGGCGLGEDITSLLRRHNSYRRSHQGGFAAIAVLGLLTAAALPTMAAAAFPGENGKIAFISDRDDDPDDTDIFVMDADGSDQTNLTNSQIPEKAPAFSADGSKIAFSFGDIFVMDADGSDQTNLTNNADFEHGPTFSPAGSKIAFMRCVGNCLTESNYEIFVMNADGSDQTRLTNNPASDFFPAFSPDGSKIAFQSLRDGNMEVYVMDADGSDQTNLTNNAAHDDLPAFSPDGSRIAFRSTRDGNSEVHVMDADGSDPINLTNDAAADEAPAFSPDGSKIAFSRCVGFCNRDFGGNRPEIFVMDADGSDQTNITNNALADTEPDWGPALQPPNAPPDCSGVSADPSKILPAKRDRFELVSLSGATDPDGDALTFTVDGVTQDEPVTARGDETSPDAMAGTDPSNVRVRSEGNPKRNGRVYRIAYTVSDGNGGTWAGTAGAGGTTTAKVSVPRSKKSAPAVDDGDATSYDSFTGTRL